MLVTSPNVSPNPSWHSQPLLLVQTHDVSPMSHTDSLQRLTKHMQPFTFGFFITIKCIGTQFAWCGGFSTGKLCLSPNIIILKFCYRPQTTLLQTRFLARQNRIKICENTSVFILFGNVFFDANNRSKGSQAVARRQTVLPSSSGALE